jgi:hypothetical protein
MITHAIETPFFHSLNTINVNKWNFTFLVSKVMSIDIVPLWPHFKMHYNCHGVWILKVKRKSTLTILKKFDFSFSKAYVFTFNASFFACMCS